MTSDSKKYACPMHEDIESDKPGRCPKCGMDLVLKTNKQKDQTKQEKKEKNRLGRHLGQEDH